MANDVRLVGGCKLAAHPRLSYFQNRDLISTSERFKCASESEAEAGRKNVMHEKSGAVWAGGGAVTTGIAAVAWNRMQRQKGSSETSRRTVVQSWCSHRWKKHVASVSVQNKKK